MPYGGFGQLDRPISYGIFEDVYYLDMLAYKVKITEADNYVLFDFDDADVAARVTRFLCDEIK